jgi:hypothetical protein
VDYFVKNPVDSRAFDRRYRFPAWAAAESIPNTLRLGLPTMPASAATRRLQAAC